MRDTYDAKQGGGKAHDARGDRCPHPGAGHGVGGVHFCEQNLDGESDDSTYVDEPQSYTGILNGGLQWNAPRRQPWRHASMSFIIADTLLKIKTRLKSG